MRHRGERNGLLYVGSQTFIYIAYPMWSRCHHSVTFTIYRTISKTLFYIVFAFISVISLLLSFHRFAFKNTFKVLPHDLVKKPFCDYCGQYCDLLLHIMNKWCHESTCLVIKENAHRLLIILKCFVSPQTYKLKPA